MFQQVRRYECTPCEGTGGVACIAGRLVPMSFDAALEHLADLANSSGTRPDELMFLAMIAQKAIDMHEAMCPECNGCGEIVFRLTFGTPVRDTEAT